MIFLKDNRYIKYELITNERYRWSYEIKNKTLYLNIPKKCDAETLERFLCREFDHVYNMMHDKEYKKFYGKKVVHYLGKTYFAKTKKANKNEMVIDGDTITIYCKEDTWSQHKAIYRRYLKLAVEKTIARYYHDVEYDFKDIKIPQIMVKGLKSKKCWGWNSGDIICLERELGRYDEKYIKAVLYHELCHCYILEHNEAFYQLMDKKMKNGSALDKELDKIIYVDEF